MTTKNMSTKNMTTKKSSGSTGGARWITASSASTPNPAADSAISALQQALASEQLELSDVAALRLWVSADANRDEVLKPWLQSFPDASTRPTVTVLRSTLKSGSSLEITAIATRGDAHRSVYEPEQVNTDWPVAVVRGDMLMVGALSAGANISEADTPQQQADAAFQRLGWILSEVGARPDGVAHMFVWYQDHEFRQVVNGPFLEMFPTPGDRPARHSLVRSLASHVAIEIEVIASISARRSCYTISGVWHGGIGGDLNSLPFGTRVGRYLFSAGTYGRDTSTGEIPDDLASQTAFAIEHSHSLLHAAGMDEQSIEHAYVWVRDVDDIGDLEAVLRRDLLGARPNVPLQVVQSPLPGTNLIQIELVAANG